MSTFLSCGVAETVRAHRSTLLAEADRERLAARLPHRRGWWTAARTALDGLSAAHHRGAEAS